MLLITFMMMATGHNYFRFLFRDWRLIMTYAIWEIGVGVRGTPLHFYSHPSILRFYNKGKNAKMQQHYRPFV